MVKSRQDAQGAGAVRVVAEVILRWRVVGVTIVQSRWIKVSRSSTASFLGGFVLSYYCAMAATRARIRSAGELRSLAVSTLVVWVPSWWVLLYEYNKYARTMSGAKNEELSMSSVCGRARNRMTITNGFCTW